MPAVPARGRAPVSAATMTNCCRWSLASCFSSTAALIWRCRTRNCSSRSAASDCCPPRGSAKLMRAGLNLQEDEAGPRPSTLSSWSAPSRWPVFRPAQRRDRPAESGMHPLAARRHRHHGRLGPGLVPATRSACWTSRPRKISASYIKNTVIPLLCRKARGPRCGRPREHHQPQDPVRDRQHRAPRCVIYCSPAHRPAGATRLPDRPCRRMSPRARRWGGWRP